MKDPQQELFTAIRSVLASEYGEENVYDFLPGKEAAYPFVYLADTQQVDDYGNKSIILGSIFQTVTVWQESPMKRGSMSEMLFEIKSLLRGIRNTGTYNFRLVNIDQRIDTDTTTGALRGDLLVEYQMMGGTAA